MGNKPEAFLKLRGMKLQPASGDQEGFTITGRRCAIEMSFVTTSSRPLRLHLETLPAKLQTPMLRPVSALGAACGPAGLGAPRGAMPSPTPSLLWR